MRNTNFTDEAWDDYGYWPGQDKKTLKRINLLIHAARRAPFDGIGKPEPLKGDLSGYWSRRIDETNRLVYAVNDKEIIIVSCRYHY
jgi:toxin YoeB